MCWYREYFDKTTKLLGLQYCECKTSCKTQKKKNMVAKVRVWSSQYSVSDSCTNNLFHKIIRVLRVFLIFYLLCPIRFDRWYTGPAGRCRFVTYRLPDVFYYDKYPPITRAYINFLFSNCFIRKKSQILQILPRSRISLRTIGKYYYTKRNVRTY